MWLTPVLRDYESSETAPCDCEATVIALRRVTSTASEGRGSIREKGTDASAPTLTDHSAS